MQTNKLFKFVKFKFVAILLRILFVSWTTALNIQINVKIFKTIYIIFFHLFIDFCGKVVHFTIQASRELQTVGWTTHNLQVHNLQVGRCILTQVCVVTL